jgi:hypothetical protein
MDAERLLKGLLWFVALSHLVIGVGGFLSPVFQEQMALFYGARVEWTGQLTYVVRMLAAFMVGLGGAGVFAARDPLRYSGVVVAFAAVMLLRVAQRFAFARDVEALFGVAAARNAFNGVFFALLSLALLGLLFVLMRRSSRMEQGVQAPA